MSELIGIKKRALNIDIDLEKLKARLLALDKKETTTLAAFGDSVMRGVMLDAASGRYITHKGRFDAVNENLNIKAENNARFGFTAERGLDQIKKSISKGSHPDIVLLEYGGNDCNFDWSIISENPKCEYDPAVTPEKFEKVYGQIIDYVLSCGSIPVIVLSPPIDAEKFLTYICRGGLSRENIVVWLGDASLIYRWQEHYSRICERIARVRDLPLLDLRTPFITRHDYPSLICEDGIHPTEKGHKLIDEELYMFARRFAK